jgi:crossover junction endodeoxyribonuclease RuvC
MHKIYVGIDHSLSGTGIAILGDKGGLICLETVSSESQGVSVRHRVWRFRGLADSVSEIVHRYIGNGVTIAVCCFEGYSFGSNKAHHSAIIESGYEVRSRMISLVAGSIFEVAPTTLKKFACGKGNADKSAVVSAMTKRHGVEFGNDNEADAYALARCAYCIGEEVDPGTEAARDSLAVITGKKESKPKRKAKA